MTATTINIAFPVVNINSEAGQLGFAQDKEYGEQVTAIHLYVNQINAAGGILGRKINPIIDTFDPQSDANEAALCKQWTEGSPPVFAVLDGIGTWEDDNQLCVTQEGHTPLLSAWSTISDWTQLGSPYLWWTGADDTPLLGALVKWGLSSGRLGGGNKVGVVVSTTWPATRRRSTTTCCPTSRRSASRRWSRPSRATPTIRPPPTRAPSWRWSG